MSRSRPRVLFYSQDRRGLGHLRRTVSIAGELARHRPDAALLAATGSPSLAAFPAPSTLDFVKLPDRPLPLLPHRPALPYWSPTDGVRQLRAALLHATARSFAPHLVVVDHEPAGLRGELRSVLAHLQTARPKPDLVMCLRDIYHAPEETASLWEGFGVHDLLDSVYDRILVCGSRAVFDVTAEYGMSAAATAKTTFCGYIQRQEPLLPAERIRGELGLGGGDGPLIVVTVGGGYDGGRILLEYLAALRLPALAGVTSVVVTGPYLPSVRRERIIQVAQLGNAVTTAFTPDLPSYLNAADLVVTMGGYNTACDVVGLGKRAVVIPRLRPSEQRVRAERFAALGLVTMLHPDELRPQRLATAIRDALDRPPPIPSLDFGGLPRIGAILADALAARVGAPQAQAVDEP